MPAIWKLSLGHPTAKGLLALSGTPTREELVSQEPCLLPAAAIQWEQILDRFVIRVPFDPNEHLYGLGLGFEGIALNMKVRHLRADHYGGKDNGRTHAPVPFYVSDSGYGVLVDTAENISFYMGGTVRKDAANPPPEMNRGRDTGWQCNQPAEWVEISFIGTGADVYLFSGERPRDVVAGFNLLCGGGCLPPKWGLGFWHRVSMFYGENEIMSELQQFADHNLSIDVLGLEPGWQSGSYPCTYDWDRERFPDPVGFVQRMAEKGIRVNLWENMYISVKSSVYERMLPYAASHKVWGGIVPDYTLPEPREILLRHHAENHPGISGYKIDECDGYDEWLWPDHAAFPSGQSATAVRNVYGVMLQRMYEEQSRRQGKRTYGLVRASNAGSSPLPFCIYNDCYDFTQFLTGLATAGFCGVLWVPEARDADTAEEWVRRFQLCALSPMLMLNAWASGTAPWKFPEVEPIILQTIQFRKQLLPYLYHAFYIYKTTGLAPFRALVMDYASLHGKTDFESGTLDDTANPYEICKISEIVDQYLVGESLMVAPMFPGKTVRTVVLPPDSWYDFYTGEKYTQAELLYSCPLHKIPLFVKEGGMIPMLQPDGSLTVRCYGQCGKLDLFDDDGETFRYETGDYALLHLQFTRDEDGTLHGKYETEVHGWQTAYRTIRFI